MLTKSWSLRFVNIKWDKNDDYFMNFGHNEFLSVATDGYFSLVELANMHIQFYAFVLFN